MKKLGLVAAIAAFVGFAGVANADGVEWNGFGGAYYGQSFSPELLPPGLADQYSNFSSPSNFGLNVGAKINDSTSVAAQLVALNSDANGDWDLKTKWAFLTYKFSNSVSVKIGRQLVPALLAAEVSSVGYLMPYRRIPDAMVAILPMSGFNGISFNYSDGGFWATAFGGRPNYDLPRTGTVTFAGGAKDLTGLAVGFDGSGFGVRAAWQRARPNLTITTPLATSGFAAAATIDTYTVGYRIDKMGLVSWGEYGMGKSSDGTPTTGSAFVPGSGGAFASSSRAGYVLVGYRVGEFLPRYTYSQLDLEVGHIFNGKTTTHTLGVNYNINPQVIFKAEYLMVSVPASTETGAGLATRATGSTATSGNAVYAGVDFVF